jgi:chromosome segregation ATPase
MVTVEPDIETDAANMTHQPDSEVLQLIETVQAEVDSLGDELERVQAENQQLHLQLGNSESEGESLKQELVEVRSQLETVQAENEALKTNQPATELEPLKASKLLNRLKSKRKKASASLADIEALLEMMRR